MKVSSDVRTLETSGNIVQGTIKAGGKAFGVFIDGIYSRKEESIVREICSNAYDAHIDAGIRDKPFSITFPSLFNQTFRVRDYGKGLSHEFMTTRYTVAFDSTKDDSNDQVGAWGIGRLSPLSYTDSYSVTSYQDGKARHYTIVRNSEGIGFVYLGINDTSESNGLEVSFPIRRNDIGTFRGAFKKISVGFDVKPTIIAAKPGDEWPNYKPLVEGSNWKLMDTSNLDYDHPLRQGAVAKMGCAIYSLAVDRPPYDSVWRKPILVEFPIGSLGVTASRENLSFGKDEPTADSIERASLVILKEYQEQIEKSISRAENWVQACRIWYEGMNSSPVGRKPFQGLTWKGMKLNHYFAPKEHLVNLSGLDFNFYEHKSWITSESKLGKSYESITLAEDTTVFVVNGAKGEKDKHVQRKIGAKLIELRAQPDCNINRVMAVTVDATNREATTSLMYLMELLSEYEFYLVSDLPEITINRSKSKPVPVRELKIFSHSLDTESVINVDQTTFDAGGLYVDTLRNEVVYDYAPAYRLRDVLQLTLRAKVFDPLAQTIYAVPGTHRSRWEKEPKWVKLFSVVEDWLETDKDEKLKFCGVAEEKGVNFNRVYIGLASMPGCNSSLLKLYLSESLKGATSSKWELNQAEMYNLYFYMSKLPKDFQQKVLPSKESTLSMALQKRYPMLNYTSWANARPTDLPILLEYVNMVDSHKGTNP